MKIQNSFDFENKLVGLIVTENIKSAFIFEKNGLRLYGNLNLTVNELKNDKTINYTALINDLADFYHSKNFEIDFSSASTDLIIDYLENYHHQRVRQYLPAILNKGKSLADSFGNEYQMIKELYSLTYALAEEILPHIDMEEKKLFPVVRTCLYYKQDLCDIKDVFNEKILVATMEHEEATGLLKEINRICDSFDIPEKTGKEGQEYFALLTEFLEDMFEHIYIEEEILKSRLKTI